MEEKVYLKVDEKTWLLFIEVLNEINGVQRNEILLRWKTFSTLVPNNYTIISKGWKTMNISQFKKIGTKNKFFQFLTKEKTEELKKLVNTNLELKKDFFAMWLWIFIDYNVDEEQLLSYVHKPKDIETKREMIASILGNDHQIINDENSRYYYYLKGEYFDKYLKAWAYDYIERELKKAIEEKDWSWIFSFLFGLFIVGYAEVNDKWIVFQIPTKKMLFLKKKVVTDIFSFLREYFVFSMDVSWITQIASKSWLFEYLFLKFYHKVLSWDTKDFEWKKLNDNEQTKEELKKFILSVGAENWDEFVKNTFEEHYLLIHTM